MQHPELISPISGTVIGAPSVVFHYTPGDEAVTYWNIQIGTDINLADIYDSGTIFGDYLSHHVMNLPNDGALMHVKLRWKVGDDPWQNKKYVFLTGYETWLNDVRSLSTQMLLIELDHANGTVCLASKPWVSNTNIVYDDWLAAAPYLESNLDNFASVGDIQAMNYDPNDDWRNHIFHGHTCRWYFGDERWKKEEFRQIASATIDECNFLGGSLYKFNLLDSGARLKRTFVTSDQTKSMTVEAAVDWLADQTGLSFIFTGVDESKFGWSLGFDVTSASLADAVLRDIATSINAKLRFDQIGNAEIIAPKKVSPTVLTENEIDRDGLRQVESTPPYSKVTVIKSDGTEISEVTNADTGELERELRVETYLTNTTQAQTLLAELINYHANNHSVWEIQAINAPNVIQVGNALTSEHPELIDTGIVGRLKRSPLTNTASVEVTL